MENLSFSRIQTTVCLTPLLSKWPFSFGIGTLYWNTLYSSSVIFVHGIINYRPFAISVDGPISAGAQSAGIQSPLDRKQSYHKLFFLSGALSVATWMLRHPRGNGTILIQCPGVFASSDLIGGGGRRSIT